MRLVRVAENSLCPSLPSYATWAKKACGSIRWTAKSQFSKYPSLRCGSKAFGENDGAGSWDGETGHERFGTLDDETSNRSAVLSCPSLKSSIWSGSKYIPNPVRITVFPAGPPGSQDKPKRGAKSL